MIPNCILILAPHTDDAELGCGGSMARFIRENFQVYVAVFSTAAESLPTDVPSNTLIKEFQTSMKILGVPASRQFIHKYPVRRLQDFRQEVLDHIIDLKRVIEPDIVFIPSGNDLHQDHQVVHQEGLRAFKESTVWGYELPWNHVTFSAQAFIQLQKSDLDKKWEALGAYDSQFDLKRPYFTREFVEGLAKVRGVQIKSDYAEAYEVIRFKW